MKTVLKRGIYASSKAPWIEIRFVFPLGQPIPPEELADLLQEIQAGIVTNEIIVHLETCCIPSLPESLMNAAIQRAERLIDRNKKHASIIQALVTQNQLQQKDLGSMIGQAQSVISSVALGRYRIPLKAVPKIRELVLNGTLSLTEEMKALLEQI